MRFVKRSYDLRFSYLEKTEKIFIIRRLLFTSISALSHNHGRNFKPSKLAEPCQISGWKLHEANLRSEQEKLKKMAGYRAGNNRL